MRPFPALDSNQGDSTQGSNTLESKVAKAVLISWRAAAHSAANQSAFQFWLAIHSQPILNFDMSRPLSTYSTRGQSCPPSPQLSSKAP